MSLYQNEEKCLQEKSQKTSKNRIHKPSESFKKILSAQYTIESVWIFLLDEGQSIILIYI